MENPITPIFLLSPSRSGSTLSQRIFGAHESIMTATEPHILIPLIGTYKSSSTTRERDVYSVSNVRLMRRSIQGLYDRMPGGKADYLEEIRNFVLRVYRRATPGSEIYFLDKTPDYHLYVEEIIDLFPEAKFIFLWRNPLSIVASLLAFGGGLWNLYWLDRHLYRAVRDLVNAYRAHHDHVHHMRYEDILTNPVETWKKAFDYLGLEFSPSLLDEFSGVELQGLAGDPNRVRPEYQTLNLDSLEKWKWMITNPIRKAWCRRYLRWLGKEDLKLMGYDLDALLASLDALPLSGKFLRTDLIRMPYGFLYRIFEFRILRKKFDALRAGQRVYVHTSILDMD